MGNYGRFQVSLANGREDKDGKKTQFKPVLSFAGTAVRLVLNVTRATVLSRFVRSKRIADFATVGIVELSAPGGLNAKGEGVAMVLAWLLG